MSVGKEEQQDRKKGGWLEGLKVRKHGGREKKEQQEEGREKQKENQEKDQRKENRKQRNFKDKFPGVSLEATSYWSSCPCCTSSPQGHKPHRNRNAASSEATRAVWIQWERFCNGGRKEEKRIPQCPLLERKPQARGDCEEQQEHNNLGRVTASLPETHHQHKNL